MTVRARAVEDCVADIGASGSTSATPANRLFRLFQVLLGMRGRMLIIKKKSVIPRWTQRYDFIRYPDMAICLYPIRGRPPRPAAALAGTL
jgi:hypothetical protein